MKFEVRQLPSQTRHVCITKQSKEQGGFQRTVFPHEAQNAEAHHRRLSERMQRLLQEEQNKGAKLLNCSELFRSCITGEL